MPLISSEQEYIFLSHVCETSCQRSPQINEGYSETILSTLKKNCLGASDPQGLNTEHLQLYLNYYLIHSHFSAVQFDDLGRHNQSRKTHVHPKMNKPLRQNIHQASHIISLWTLPTNLHIYNFDLAFFFERCDSFPVRVEMHDFIQKPGGAIEQQQPLGSVKVPWLD